MKVPRTGINGSNVQRCPKEKVENVKWTMEIESVRRILKYFIVSSFNVFPVISGKPQISVGSALLRRLRIFYDSIL
ncbi:MAG: hypothetical protein V1720_15375 [bacterium]